MDIIESIKKDKAYLKCKLIVKNWEKEFKKKYSRTPSKFDIKEAPANIKYAYKKYFQLKSAFLENSLSACDIDEEPIGSPESVQHLDRLSFDCPNPLSELLLPTLPSGEELHELITDSKSQQNANAPSPFVENLSKKLFNNRKFSLRNPRKLSRIQSSQDYKKDASISDKDVEPNLSVDFGVSKFNVSFIQDITCTKNSLSSDVIQISLENVTPKRQIDEAWINRADDILEGNNVSVKNKTYEFHSFGLSNIKVPNSAQKLNDYVENSESEEDKEFDKLKPALKKRKLNNLTKYALPPKVISSTDTQSYPSSSYTLGKNNKSPHKKVVEIENVNDNSKEQCPPDIREYIPFGIEEVVTPRHYNITDILKNNSTTKITHQDKENTVENKLKEKIKLGTMNENFVKINIEKKVFVRGKKSKSYTKFKKQQWKDKKALHAGMEFPENGKISCFKCGLTGHMARYCSAHKGDTLLPLESYDDNDLPTLEDMQSIVSKETNNIPNEEILSKSVSTTSKIPDSFLKMLESNSFSNTDIKPIYTNYEQKAPKEVYEILKKFGHDYFRSGQERAIMRILCGMSTLLILSTGGGKSLCYQLPAYIYSQYYKCITLVISPLVSLMEDQVLSMPEFLKAGCLHTGQPPTQRRKIIQCLKDGEINILLISPEALVSGDNSNGFAGLFKYLPKIAFACIDEAHCVSQWSHNFRPSYLMICRVLREKLNVNCILGLTATASQPTIQSVISHINIPDNLEGVITNPTLPDNLILSVSFEKEKDRALVSFLASERIESFNSIIVYCIRRDECERVAAILRSCLQEPNQNRMEKKNNKRKRMSYTAEAYHAGMSAAQRKKIQKHFMDGTLRIIVATVAFGMGINKSNIRCIIHYNMPSCFESYVQEVGRAGRDGQTAYCHVFMSYSSNDKNELLKHIHANTIDRPVIRKLLHSVFIPCGCVDKNIPSSSRGIGDRRCNGHEVGIPIDSTVEDLDLPSENISTLLCYVELHPKQYIKVLNNAYIMCKISSYGGPKKILEAATACAPLAMAYLLESKKKSDVMKNTILEFNVIEVAAAIGWESGMTKYHLKNLEWITENGMTKRSQLKVELNTLGFRVKAPGDLNPTELDNILDDLHNSVVSQEKARLYQLEEINKAFSDLGNYSLESNIMSDEFLKSKSDDLKLTIRNYFQRDTSILHSNIALEKRPFDTERVTADVCALLSCYKDCDFTGRSVARIFQGISSPNYPAIVWGKCKFWRTHIHEDFYGLIKTATEQIIRNRIG
ncbi:hypothetical protein evm_011416 [Chilo suppressalis]|nr:hypothetical protein evm_011416 [Chilo suppressalis]